MPKNWRLYNLDASRSSSLELAQNSHSNHFVARIARIRATKWLLAQLTAANLHIPGKGINSMSI
tara:strand:+ start:323 stop:514 length:192 start_codon:yes stop_codon:yes gene_type:complete